MAASDREALAARVHAALPQTQCTRCGYADCADYAQAIASGAAPLNQCPPGGAEGILRLAALTGHPAQPLNPGHGTEGPRSIALIDEAWCIGCTLCIKACPTDAILGSNQRMHTVVEAYCTGCELCIPACPVDCISLVNVSGERTGWDAWSPAQADQALARYRVHRQRLERDASENALALERKAREKRPGLPVSDPGTVGTEAERKRAAITAALEKARTRRPPGG